MSAILSAFGPKAWKAVLGGLAAAIAFLIAHVDAQTAAGIPVAIGLGTIIKALGAGFVGHQGVYWKGNA